MRTTVTIPAAGKKLAVKMTGYAILIEAANTYSEPAEVPSLSFPNGNNDYPIYPRSTYQNGGEMFNSIDIIGTSESAGDELTLLSVDECLPSNINIMFRDTSRATLQATATKAASDVSQTLSELELQNADGLLPVAMTVAAVGGTTGGIRYAFDTDASQAGNDSYQLHEEPFRIEGINYILAFNFIAEVSGELPNLVYTCEY